MRPDFFVTLFADSFDAAASQRLAYFGRLSCTLPRFVTGSVKPSTDLPWDDIPKLLSLIEIGSAPR
jgi:hypothetical protein